MDGNSQQKYTDAKPRTETSIAALLGPQTGIEVNGLPDANKSAPTGVEPAFPVDTGPYDKGAEQPGARQLVNVMASGAPPIAPPAIETLDLLAKQIAAELAGKLEGLKFDELAARVEARIETLQLDAFKVDPECYYSQRDLAKLLGLSMATLEQWRSKGGFIPYTKCGKKCLYHGSHVLKFLHDGLRRSASDKPGAPGRVPVTVP